MLLGKTSRWEVVPSHYQSDDTLFRLTWYNWSWDLKTCRVEIHKHWTLLKCVCMCVCIKHSKSIKPMQHTFHYLPPFPQQDSLTRTGIFPNQCFTCWLTRPAAGWHSSGVVLHWGRRGELGGSSAQTAAGSAAWCSLELTECCWLHDPPCCGRH